MTDKIKTVGSKAEVYHGTSLHTSSYLYKKDLMKTKKGRIVSKKQHKSGLKAIKRLFAAGYKPKKGTFKLFHKGKATKSATRKSRSTKKRSTRRRRGGFADGSGNSMNPMAGVMKATGGK